MVVRMAFGTQTVPSSATSSLTLRNRLGPWFTSPPLNFPWLWSPSLDRVSFQPASVQAPLQVFSRLPGRTRRQRYRLLPNNVTTVPNNAKRVTAVPTSDSIILVSAGRPFDTSLGPTIPGPLDDDWAIEFLDLPSRGSSLAMAIS